MNKSLLRLVLRGKLLPPGKKIETAMTNTDGTREQKLFETLLPESREIVGYLYVEDDVKIPYLLLIPTVSVTNHW